jgi:hypothetical protein
MSAGYIQLAAIGQQDAYLSGKPNLTYFQGLYSRNTPFVLEAYDIPFNGSKQAFGTQQICKIPFKGDVVRGLTLKTNMPFLKNPGNDWNWSNVASENGFYPKIIIDNVYLRAPTQGVTYYSSNVDAQSNIAIGWITYPAPLVLYTSAITSPVTGTSITIPFTSGTFKLNFNLFVGDVATVSNVAGGMIVTAATTTSITFSINSQTTTTIPASTAITILPARSTVTPSPTTQLVMPANPVAVTSIVVPFPANVWGVSVFPGYTMTMTGISGTMLISSLALATSTYSNVSCTIPSQTTASIPIGTILTVKRARTLSANVFYNANVNKFAFTAYSNVEVLPYMATFWGLDPKNFDSVTPSGNLNYIITATSGHPSTIGTAPFPAFPYASADFTLEQGGWTRGSGIPSAEKRAGIYFEVEQSIEPAVVPTSVQFQLYGGNYLFFNTSRGTYISQVAGSTFCFQSTNGNIAFTRPGQYCIRGNLTASDTDAIFSVAYTYSLTDTVPPLNFIAEHVIQTTSQPTPTFTIPLNITIPPGSSYVFVSLFIRMNPVNAKLRPGSWIAVGPVDQFFTNSGTSITGTEIALQNFTSYPPVSTASLVTLIPASNSFTFQSVGSYLITTVLGFQASALTSVKLSYGTRGSGTVLYTYDTYQGSFPYPSLDFTIPVNVTSSTLGPYYMDITMQNLSGSVSSDTMLASNVCTIQIVQIGSTNPTISFTQNSLLLRPAVSSFIMPNPINFSTASWNTPIGGTVQLGLSGSQIAIYQGGLYYVQLVLCTEDFIKAMTITVTGASTLTATYPIGLGLLPPYSIGVPFFVPAASLILPALVTIGYTTPAGGTTTAYSNTVVSIGPLASNVTDVYTYIDSVGTYMIDNAELRIGGQLVQRLTGEQIELYNDLYVPYENQPGLKLLTGKQDTSNVFDPGRTYYTNLPFYFYGNNELSIPVAALDRSDVEVAVTFRPFNTLSFVSNIASVNQSMSATMIVEYGYLSENEVKWMRRNRLEYLITQTQATSFLLPPGFSTGTFKLPFVNPVREIYIVIQNQSTAPYDFSNNGLTNLGLSFNGQEYLSRQVIDAQYLQYVQAFQKYNVTPVRQFYVYSFANDPMNPRPTGQINFSRMKDSTIDITLAPLSGLTRSMRIYATNYNVLRIENGLAGIMFNF